MKLKIEVDMDDLIQQIWWNYSQEEFLQIIKGIDDRVSTREFTQRIYDYAKHELERMED